jgi:hypothetical protein
VKTKEEKNFKYLTDQDIEKFFQTAKMKINFICCAHCGKSFSELAPGTKNRNHCPFCLYSVHLDKVVGDRAAHCFGQMEVIGKFRRPNMEEILIHRCLKCGKVSNNRVAGDDDAEEVAKLPVIQI